LKNKVWSSFDDAVADIGDNASVAVFAWGIAGMPQNLIQALIRKGAKGLTLIGHNFLPGRIGPDTFDEVVTPLALVKQARKIITAWPGTLTSRLKSPLLDLLESGEVELEITSHGTLVERLRAGGSGIGGFFSPVGVGTVLEEGKEVRVINGKKYILETPLRADFGLVRAFKADKLGNLVYRGSGRGCNPIIAMASDITIAEVDEIVEVGELDPEVIVTPGIFVDRTVKIPEGGPGSYQHRANVLEKALGQLERSEER